MGPNKADPADLVVEIEFYDKSVLIALNIENDPIVLQYTGTWIFLF